MNPNDPNRIQEHYEDEFNRLSERKPAETKDSLRDLESNHSGPTGGSKSSLQEQEQSGGGGIINNYTGRYSSGGSRSIKGVFNKRNGVAGTIITIALLALGIGSSFLGGTLAPLMAVHNITDDLNDQLSALETGTNTLFRRKIRPLTGEQETSFGCTKAGSTLSMKCRFSTMSKKTIQRLEAVGFTIEGEEKLLGRMKPTKITFQGVSYGPDDFLKALGTEQEIFRAHLRANNMKFIGLSGNTFVRRALGKFGLKLSPPELSGSYEDRVNRLLALKGGGDTLSSPTFSEARDDKGNRLQTPSGEDAFHMDGDTSSDRVLFSEADTKKALDAFDKVGGMKNSPTHFKPGQINAIKAVNAFAIADQICDLRNMVGAATIAAKVSNAAQLASFAIDLASFAGKMKAGDIDAEEAEYVQRMFTDPDNRKTIDGLIDRGGDQYDADEISNPTYGMNAMDSELYKMSAGGGVAPTSTVDRNYSLGFGTNSTLKSGARFIGAFDKVSSFGTDTSACRIIQKKWMRRVGALAGVILGGVSFGGFNLISGSISAAIFISTQAVGWALKSAMQSDLITETLLKEASVERGSAFWTGMSVILGQAALSRGMMPASTDEILAYQQQQDVTRQKYLALERQDAHPLDIRNPYSLVGTTAFSIYSHIPNSMSGANLSSIATSVSSFALGGLGSILQPYSAKAASLDPSRFEQCDDDTYKEIGINPDVQCNIRYVMPQRVLDIDPIEAAEYMEDNEYVEENSTTGLPKGYTPPDPSKEHNIARQFVMGIVDGFYDTRDYKNDYGKFLDFCVYRALPFGETYEEFEQIANGAGRDWGTGKKCRENSPMIDYFRAYTFYISANDDLDEGAVEDDCDDGISGSGAALSESDVKKLITTSYKLPEADSAEASKLAEQLRSNSDGLWAAKALLEGERVAKSKGFDVKEYLSTAWMWAEMGPGGRPDPYMINCNDIPSASHVSNICHGERTGFQVAGYQAQDRASQFREVYDKIYSESDLHRVMQNVIENSSKTESIWSYKDESQRARLAEYFDIDDLDSASVNDIASGQDLFNARTQIVTLIVGKDPAMVAALNSYAVSDGDLINAIENAGSSGYMYGSSYYDANFRKRLSNMMLALHMIDDGKGAGGSMACASDMAFDVGRGAGEGLRAIWGGVGEKTITQKFDELAAGVNPNWYAYGIENFGTNGGHTGTDIGMEPYSPVYSPVEGIVVCERNGVGEGAGNGGPACAGAADYSLTGGYGCTTAAGVIKGKPGGAGTVMIKITKNGVETGDVLVLGHLASSLVKLGDKVSPNQQVGTTGCMNGFHVHVEYYIQAPGQTSTGWKLVDPEVYLGRGSNA